MPTNRQITLAARPEGFPQESDFALVEAPVAEPGAGEVLVRARWLSLDPYMRGRMSTTRSYAKSTELGEVMTGQVVGEVVASEDWPLRARRRGRRPARLAGLRGRARRDAPQDRHAARAAAGVPPRPRHDRPHGLLRPLRRRAAEAGRHRRRLGRGRGGRPGDRPAGEDRRVPCRRHRGRPGEGGRADRAVRLRRWHRLQGGRRQRRAEGAAARTASTSTSTTSAARSPRRSSAGSPSARGSRSAARSRSTTWRSRSSRRATSAS